MSEPFQDPEPGAQPPEPTQPPPSGYRGLWLPATGLRLQPRASRVELLRLLAASGRVRPRRVIVGVLGSVLAGLMGDNGASACSTSSWVSPTSRSSREPEDRRSGEWLQAFVSLTRTRAPSSVSPARSCATSPASCPVSSSASGTCGCCGTRASRRGTTGSRHRRGAHDLTPRGGYELGLKSRPSRTTKSSSTTARTYGATTA